MPAKKSELLKSFCREHGAELGEEGGFRGGAGQTDG